jgi:glycosyltransferase involved in cell wall biosynthesis
MRILMLSWEYPPNLDGGLGAHVTELVPALAALGADLTLVTPRWKGGAPAQRVNEHAMVYRVDPPVETPSNYYADAQQTNLTLQQFVQELWQEQGGFDLIHAHDWLVSFVAIALKKFYKTPLIATMHATERGRSGGHLFTEMSRAINGAEWWLTYEAWRVITTSRYMADEVRAYFELPADKVVVIPNGVESKRFEHLLGQDLRSFREEWAAPDEKIVFYVGRLQYEKGLHLLIEAANRILRSGQRVKFIIAGRGPLLAPLRQRVSELGLQERILLPGYISDPVRDRLYSVADAAVFPSLYEPFGIVALEAMAAKCPLIVSNVGGLGEVVTNHETGIKIPSYDLDVLVDSIEYVLRNPERARACAERAYETVRREYDWNGIARDTLGLYQQIVADRSRNRWE